jgi:cell division protein FtsL
MRAKGKTAAAEKSRAPIGRRPSGVGRRTFVGMAVVAAVVAAVGVTHTWTRVAVLERKYQLAHARAENERLSSELTQLSLEADTWQSAAKVDQAARTSLSMAKPPPVNVVVVEADTPALRPRAAVASNER